MQIPKLHDQNCACDCCRETDALTSTRASILGAIAVTFVVAGVLLLTAQIALKFVL